MGRLKTVTALATTPLAVLGLLALGSDHDRAGADIPGIDLAEGSVPAEYETWIRRAGGLCPDVPPTLLAAQIEAESNWNPQAASHAGAQGLAQFMPGTWPSWGEDDDGNGRADPADPGDAIMAQGRYMCALAGQMRSALNDGRVTGDVLDLALASYNAGPGAVLGAGGVPSNGETDKYVPKIRQLMGKYGAIGPQAGGEFGDRVVNAALEFEGTAPYVWGGGDVTGPTRGSSAGVGFDCSGLVQYAVYQASGGTAVADRPADTQARQGKAVSRDDMRPGDIIAFKDSGAGSYHHIGIYMGNQQMVHAPTFGETVKVSSLTESYWTGQDWSVRRYG